MPNNQSPKPASQPRSGSAFILTSPSGWQLQFQDLPSVQWLQALMHNNPAEGGIK